MSRRYISTTVLAGVLLGTFCAFANYSIVTTNLGQMVAPWILTAALLGGLAASPRGAMIGGLIALPVAVAVYYLIAAIDRGLTTQRFFITWTVLGLLVGPLAGLAGWTARNGPSKWRVIAVAAITAMVLAEAVVLWQHIDDPAPRATFALALVAGLAIPLLVLRDLDFRARLAGFLLGIGLAVPTVFVLDFVFGRVGIVTPS